MSQLDILRYPDPRLHKVARPVAAVDDRIRRLVDDMLETMYAADGVGLAATQVDVHERVIVIDTSEARDEPIVLINPELIDKSEEMTLVDEGCLSVPEVYDKVPRHARVRVRALDRSARRASSTPRGCSRSPSSTRWITCSARSSSST
jgi:peptide deformylase